jgi:hypothetical protein
LLDVLRNRIDYSAFVITFLCPEQPAVNERVDLGAVKFDREAAKAGPTACPATTHSACGGFPSGFGLDGHTVNRLPNHTNVLSDAYCSAIVPDCIGCRTLSQQCRPAFRDRSMLPRLAQNDTLASKSGNIRPSGDAHGNDRRHDHAGQHR